MTDGNVYRSPDEGETWELQTVPSKMPGIDTVNGRVAAIILSAPENGHRRLYLLGWPARTGGQKLWVSEDNGLHYESRPIPDGTWRILEHPIFADRAMALRVSANGYEAFLTSDTGKTWKSVTNELLDAGSIAWGFPDQHPNRVYAVLGGQSSWDHRLIRTDDWFQTQHTVLDHVRFFALRNDDDIIAAQYVDRTANSLQLVLSEDAGVHWHLAEFPNKGEIERLEMGWTIFDTSEDAIFVGVWRDLNLPWADIYKSDSYDKNFVMSLEYQRPMDFVRFAGLDGIYLANRWNTTHPFNPVNEDDIDTVISFNKGATWELLQPPKKRWSGESSDCDVKKGCSLHLHGFNSGGMFTWFYSVPNAPGLMLATGNIGDELLTEREEVNTYVSRDAGVTWFEVAPGPWVPEFGDSGSIMVIANSEVASKSIKFSLNQGADWTECSLRDQNMKIDNIRVAPAWDSKQFILYGSDLEKHTPILIGLDFQPVAPDCKPEDYEEWSPVDEHGHCVMGQRLTFKRRKPEAKCWNGEKYNPKPVSEPCLCSDADYECDYCFRFDDVLDKCVFDCFKDRNQTAQLAAVKPDDVCSTETNRFYWEVPGKGYRKVADNKCDDSKPNAVKLPNGLAPCNILRPSGVAVGGSAAIIISFIVLLVVAVVIATIVLVWRHGTSVRAWFGGSGSSDPNGGSAYGRVVETIEDDEESPSDKNGGVTTKLDD
eukprot:TRINITY_DN6543_c0_g1_i1.p1 TRINITY_DN6543_c0_g1~~TRINITY_DN6543_c0_g1_i1.p1  ORF type:complete len:779 (-),score=188.84 TRINITY_DN6543_c0_g1_i1:34-2166(-)